MKNILLIIAACLALGYGLESQSKRKSASRKASMVWEDSLLIGKEEARLRNIPIVVHLLSDT